jgi:Tfp pilus assembly protein PilN
MFDINIIRRRIVPERQKKVIFSVISFSALVYVLTFLGVICFSFANFKMIDVYAREIDGLQEDLSVLYPGTPTHDELSTMIGRVRPDLSEIEDLLDRRLRTSGMWEGIARSVPDGVWLEHVQLTAPGSSSDGGKKKGKGETKPGGILIKGFAIADQPSSGSDAIGKFTKGLEDDPALTGRLTNVKSAETGMRRAGGSSVVGFEITGDFKR